MTENIAQTKSPAATDGGSLLGQEASVVLEHWDEVRGKWLLYRKLGEHHADCERCSFERIPPRRSGQLAFADHHVLVEVHVQCDRQRPLDDLLSVFARHV